MVAKESALRPSHAKDSALQASQAWRAGSSFPHVSLQVGTGAPPLPGLKKPQRPRSATAERPRSATAARESGRDLMSGLVRGTSHDVGGQEVLNLGTVMGQDHSTVHLSKGHGMVRVRSVGTPGQDALIVAGVTETPSEKNLTELPPRMPHRPRSECTQRQQRSSDPLIRGAVSSDVGISICNAKSTTTTAQKSPLNIGVQGKTSVFGLRPRSASPLTILGKGSGNSAVRRGSSSSSSPGAQTVPQPLSSATQAAGQPLASPPPPPASKSLLDRNSQEWVKSLMPAVTGLARAASEAAAVVTPTLTGAREMPSSSNSSSSQQLPETTDPRSRLSSDDAVDDDDDDDDDPLQSSFDYRAYKYSMRSSGFRESGGGGAVSSACPVDDISSPAGGVAGWMDPEQLSHAMDSFEKPDEGWAPFRRADWHDGRDSCQKKSTVQDNLVLNELHKVVKALISLYDLPGGILEAAKIHNNKVTVTEWAWNRKSRDSQLQEPPVFWVRGGRVYDFHGDRGTIQEFEADCCIDGVEEGDVIRSRRKDQGLLPFPFLATPQKWLKRPPSRSGGPVPLASPPPGSATDSASSSHGRTTSNSVPPKACTRPWKSSEISPSPSPLPSSRGAVRSSSASMAGRASLVLGSGSNSTASAVTVVVQNDTKPQKRPASASRR